MVDAAHIIGSVWSRSATGYVHGVLYWDYENRDEDDNPITQLLKIERGETLHWSLRGPRVCVGFRDGTGRRQPCPERTVITSGSAQCGPCQASDLFLECYRCDGTICHATAERRDECRNTDYVVYLAVFGDSLVKVGVSTRARVQTRWVEQGADYAGVIAEIRDGKEARRIESRVASSSRAVSVVRSPTKARMMALTPNRGRVEESVAHVVRQAIEAGLDVIEPEIVILENHYRIGQLPAEPTSWVPSGRERPTEVDILGEVVGMKGSIVVTRTGATIRYIDLRWSAGRRLVKNPEMSIEVQSAIEEFF